MRRAGPSPVLGGARRGQGLCRAGCLVVDDVAHARVGFGTDEGVVEASGLQEVREGEVGLDVAVAEQLAAQEGVRPGDVAADVHQVEAAAGAQDAAGLGEGRGLDVGGEVVQHQGRQDPVEFAVGMGQVLGVTALEAKSAQSLRLSFGTGQCLGVRIGADHFGGRLGSYRLDDEIAGTAADLDDAMSGSELGLRDEAVVECGRAQCPGEQVEGGEQDVVPGRREVVV